MLALKRLTVVTAVVVLAQTGSAFAAGKNPTKITSQQACETAIKDTQEARAGNPVLGPKAAKAFDGLMELAAQRCQSGEFQYADDLLVIARGMVSSE